MTPDGARGHPVPPPDRPGEREPEAGRPRTIEVVQARLLARIGALTGAATHDLRNHLQGLELKLAALRQTGEGAPEPVRELAEGAARDVEKMGGVLSALVKLVRLSAPVVERIEVNDLLVSVREAMATEASLAGVTVNAELDPSAPTIEADPALLRRALTELLRNSLRALHATHQATVVLSSRVEAQRLTIAVADNGPGFPAAVRQQTFRLFPGVRPDGSGVGLAVARHVVEILGGELVLVDREGGGTVIELGFPPTGG